LQRILSQLNTKLDRRLGAIRANSKKPWVVVWPLIQHFFLIPPKTEIRIHFLAITAGKPCEKDSESRGAPLGQTDRVPGGKQNQEPVLPAEGRRYPELQRFHLLPIHVLFYKLFFTNIGKSFWPSRTARKKFTKCPFPTWLILPNSANRSKETSSSNP
jgi:hypothetical protein